MRLSTWRERVITVTISRSYLTVATMCNNIPTLICRYFFRALLGLLLCIMTRGITFVTFASHGPSAVVPLYNMLVCHIDFLVKGKITRSTICGLFLNIHPLYLACVTRRMG